MYTNHYERSYGISLLDDLHNLFPEILYDPERFQQNTLVRFLRDRTSQLFDLEFARNRAYYRLYIQPRETPPPRVRPPPPIVARTTSGVEPLFGVANRPQQPTTYTVPIVTTTIDTGGSIQDTLNLFTSALLGGLQGSTDLQDLLTSVPVVPTPQQIANATILSSVEPAADVVCAICQDHASPNGQEWRILRSCSHRFHKHCIDTWFQRNVHCPVCRHDIRESNADV